MRPRPTIRAIPTSGTTTRPPAACACRRPGTSRPARGVVVAVIDTGYRPHADLAARSLPATTSSATTAVANDGNGRDSDASDPGDGVTAGECGGGQPLRRSHPAGTARTWPARSPRATNNGTGVAGVAFGAKVLPVRALGKCGGYTSDIADAIIWAVRRHGRRRAGQRPTRRACSTCRWAAAAPATRRRRTPSTAPAARRGRGGGGGQQQCQRRPTPARPAAPA